MKKLGEKLFGNFIDVTDPCYDHNVWCRINNIKIKPGIYNCYYSTHDGKEWGERISSIKILHKENLKNVVDITNIGTIGVDAGLAGFFENKPDYKDKEWYDFCDKLQKEEEQTGLRAHICDCGFYSSSGYGDGVYPVFLLKNANNETIGIKIQFVW